MFSVQTKTEQRRPLRADLLAQAGTACLLLTADSITNRLTLSGGVFWQTHQADAADFLGVWHLWLWPTVTNLKSAESHNVGQQMFTSSSVKTMLSTQITVK